MLPQTRDRLIAAVSVLVALLILVMVVITSTQEQAGPLLQPRPCANIRTPFAKFEVSACPGFRGRRGRCELTVGKPFNIKLDFNTPKDFSDAVTYTRVNKMVDIFFLATVGGHCPARAGDRQQLSWDVVLPPSAAAADKSALSTDLMVGIRLATSDDFLFCYTLPARILPAPQVARLTGNTRTIGY